MSSLKTRNCSIDLFRYVCAVLVIAIHTHPLADVSAFAESVIFNVLTRVGVPFFFAVAGYFYIQKLEKGQKPLWSYLKRLVLTYFLWSCIYYLVNFIEFGHNNVIGFAADCVLKFFLLGSYYHFWFFPAMIYTVLLTTLLYKLKLQKFLIPLSVVFYLLGCLGASYYGLGAKIPVFNLLLNFSQFQALRRILFTGFPFFVLGHIIHKVQHPPLIRKPSTLYLCTVLAALLWFGEVTLVNHFALQRDTVITLGLYLFVGFILLLLFKHPLPRYRALSEKCRVLANFSYYSHPLFILALETLSASVLPFSISETPLFLLTVLLTAVFGWVLAVWNNKWANYFVN